MTNTPSKRVPVTVVTGFLGAGKSTLVRHLLLHSGRRLAVLVNEFGEVGIDGDLIADCGFCPADERAERVVELANGCLCCTVQDDFLPTMERLLERAERLDGIVVETSGLALPEPLLAAFRWPVIRTRTRVNGVVTVVDGEALAAGHVVRDPAAIEAQRQADPSLDHLQAIDELFHEQLEAADLVLLSRADCLGAEQLEAARERLQPHLPAGVAVLPLAKGALDPALILDAPPRSTGDAIPDHDHDHDHDHHDHAHVAIEAEAFQLQGLWSRQQLEPLLHDLLRSGTVVRLKGRLIEPGKQRPLQIQAVGPRLECWYEGEVSADADPSGRLDLVLMGFGLDRVAIAHGLQPQGSQPLGI
ncbi:MAG: cobalamin biosynthesis protein CobW [Cyanobacteriota bacterium]|nr:cobalamin biosynthesis protein CobW [Cyanobacteriota bacterium]